MAYARVTRTENGCGAILYAQGKGKGHNGEKYRNEYISTVNMMDGIDPIVQMQKYWMRAARTDKIQIIRVVQSFSKKEFDPENQTDILTANRLGEEFAKRHYPGRQSMVFTQTDGKSGLVYNHILVNDVHMETSFGCDKNQYFWKRIGEWTDKITSEYTTLDKGEKNIDKMSQTERAKRELGKYVWKDDLKDRVRKAMDETRFESEFFDNLKKNGIGVIEGKSKKYGTYYTYELKDLSRVPEGTKLPNRALKARSYKLGESWGLQALNDFLYYQKGCKYRDIELSVTGEIEEQEFERKEEIKPETKEKVVEKELTEEEKLEKEQREKESKEFADWCDSIGEQWMTKDSNGSWQFDWDKRDELRLRFNQENDKLKEEVIVEEIVREKPEVVEEVKVIPLEEVEEESFESLDENDEKLAKAKAKAEQMMKDLRQERFFGVKTKPCYDRNKKINAMMEQLQSKSNYDDLEFGG